MKGDYRMKKFLIIAIAPILGAFVLSAGQRPAHADAATSIIGSAQSDTLKDPGVIRVYGWGWGGGRGYRYGGGYGYGRGYGYGGGYGYGRGCGYGVEEVDTATEVDAATEVDTATEVDAATEVDTATEVDAATEVDTATEVRLLTTGVAGHGAAGMFAGNAGFRGKLHITVS